MNDKAFVLNNLAYGFIEVLENYKELFDENNQRDFKGLCDGLATLDEDHENYLADVQYYLNIAIDITTGLEDQMSEDDQEDIEAKHKTIRNLDALDELHQGQLIIYEGSPYQIYEIDGDDLTICIGDKEDENGFWVDPCDVKTKV